MKKITTLFLCAFSHFFVTACEQDTYQPTQSARVTSPKKLFFECSASTVDVDVMIDFETDSCEFGGRDGDLEVSHPNVSCVYDSTHRTGLSRVNNYWKKVTINRETLRLEYRRWSFGSEAWSQYGRCTLVANKYKF